MACTCYMEKGLHLPEQLPIPWRVVPPADCPYSVLKGSGGILADFIRFQFRVSLALCVWVQPPTNRALQGRSLSAWPLTVGSMPSTMLCISLLSSLRAVRKLPAGTSLADEVSEDSSIEESVETAESALSFPRRCEQR